MTIEDQGIDPGYPSSRLFLHGNALASQVPGEPLCAHALLLDPGEVAPAGLLADDNVVFRSN